MKNLKYNLLSFFLVISFFFCLFVSLLQVMNQPGAEGACGFGAEVLHARGGGLARLQRLRLEAQRSGTWNARLFWKPLGFLEFGLLLGLIVIGFRIVFWVRVELGL